MKTDTNKMKFNKLIFGLLICFITTNLFAQTNTTADVKVRKFAVYGGVGPNVYFNNLVVAKNYVKELNYSFAFRFMWEPEHNLSLGIESGYYQLYTVDFGDLSDVKIKNTAVPIQLVVCMKFLKTFYFNFSSGQSILYNNVSGTNGNDVKATTLSLGDYSGAIGYRRQGANRISLGVETKFYYASKLDDKNIALLFMVGYKI